MDFCQLLHKAQKNDQNTANGGRYYSTKFEPPKKVKKETKDLSANIKKFLAKKEAEEQKKRDEDLKKKEDLLALRAQDKKATRRVNVMLKRTKSANQSVLEEAVDKTHTAVTRAGPEQPDEDDYGYVSQEASALYEKMMEKYSQMPEEPKFDMFKKKVSTNLTSTKDRVKAALEREREEAMQPHKRKRKKKNEDGKEGEEKKEEDIDDNDGDDSPVQKESIKEDPLKDAKEKEEKKAKPKPRPAAPPPMSFTELLKIAAQKQHEPILIEEKPQEEDKLYTKKQRKEMERERESRERREMRHKEMENRYRNRDEKDQNKTSKSVPPSTSESKILEKELTKSNPSKERDRPIINRSTDKDRIPSKQVKFATPGPKLSSSSGSDAFKKPLSVNTSKSNKLSSNNSSNNSLKSDDIRHKNENYKQLKPNPSGSSSSSKSALPNSSNKGSVPSRSSDQKPWSISNKSALSAGASRDAIRKSDSVSKKGAPPQMASGKFGGKPREFPPRDMAPKGKPKEFPPKDLKPKQFPPPDVRGVKRKQPLVASRGRIIDDDDEEEYDSELDDFIDDEPEEGDYSSYIKEIFGYDKSRYRDIDEDDANMETSFAQQMKEEVISTKLGIMEDLEDMKQEEEAKRRKALMKKKMRH